MAEEIKNKYIKNFELLLNDSKTVGKVFQELEEIGISNISITKTDHSDIQSFKTLVKTNAIKAAKEKAKSLTNAIDQNIGKVIYIEETNFQVYGLANHVAGLASNIKVKRQSYLEKEEDKTATIEFEKIKLKYSILTRFEIVE